jgi:ABC-type glycerol-3-phosphate transport system substrate-binding protein
LRKRINRKSLVFLIAFFMVFSSALLLLPVRAAPKPKPAAGVDLTITMLGDQQKPGVENVTDPGGAFWSSPLSHGINSVTVESSGADATAQLTNLQTLLQGGTATADVVDIDVVWTAPFADNGWIIPLDSYITDVDLNDYGSGIVAACEYQGQTYAFPYFMNLGVLYYRKDLLDLHMPGWDMTAFDTWEHLTTTANYILNNQSGLLTSADSDLVGYIGQFDAYEGGVVNFFEWCGSNGALDVITSSGDVNIDTTKVTEAMDFIAALVPPQYTGVQGTPSDPNPYIIPRYGLVSDEASSGNLWLANNSIFLRQWPYIYSLSEANKIDFGLAPLPHFAGATGYKTSAVGGGILAVPTTTTGVARQAAINLTKYLGMTEAQEAELTAIDPSTSAPQGNFPALLSVFDSPPAGFEYIKNWSAQAALTLSRPVHPDYPLISNSIAGYFQNLLSGVKTVDTALADMQRDVYEIIHGVTPPPIPGFSIAIVILSVAFTVGIITLARKKIK